MKKLKNIKTLEIKRSKWLTPDKAKQLGIKSTLLHEGSGCMCCLGFALKKAGVPYSMLNDKYLPIAVPGISDCQFVTRTEVRGVNNTPLSDDAVEINDDDNITNEEREEQLTRRFEESGITLTFVN